MLQHVCEQAWTCMNTGVIYGTTMMCKSNCQLHREFQSYLNNVTPTHLHSRGIW